MSGGYLLLLADKALPEKNLDHSLGGNWRGYRECHIKPDLLLIYSKPDQYTLRADSTRVT
jgi:mRNA interferase YafQ